MNDTEIKVLKDAIAAGKCVLWAPLKETSYQVESISCRKEEDEVNPGTAGVTFHGDNPYVPDSCEPADFVDDECLHEPV